MHFRPLPRVFALGLVSLVALTRAQSATVEARPDAANTLILFMSDNGGVTTHASNAPWRDGKFSVYEGGIHVCAAIRWPSAGLSGGKKSDALLGYIDVVPTLLKAAGIPLPTGAHALDGVDLLPILRGTQAPPKRNWYSYYAQGGRPPAAAVIRGEWKLVHIGGDVLSSDRAEHKELYRLSEDPREELNLATEHADIVNELSSALAEFGRWQPADGVGEYGAGRDAFKAPKDWVITR